MDPLHVTFFGTLFGLIALIRSRLVRDRRVPARDDPHDDRRQPAARPDPGGQVDRDRRLAFVSGLIGAAIALPIAAHKLVANGWTPPVWQTLSLTSGVGLRVVLGTAAIAGVAAILGLAAGAIFRRSTGAIMATTGIVVVPVILAVVLPLTTGTWLLRITPAAAFSLQAGVPRYSQVSNVCAPYHSVLPAVTVVWLRRALRLGRCRFAGAIFLLRRRDV